MYIELAQSLVHLLDILCMCVCVYIDVCVYMYLYITQTSHLLNQNVAAQGVPCTSIQLNMCKCIYVDTYIHMCICKYVET